jgi:hypothetical protein
VSNTVIKVVQELAGSFPAKEGEVEALKKEFAVQQMELNEQQMEINELKRITVGQTPLPCRPHCKTWAHCGLNAWPTSSLE